MKTIVQLTASPFLGGPERQMLGLAESLRDTCRTVFLSFAERGKCRPFLDKSRELGFKAIELTHNTPHFLAAVQEISQVLLSHHAELLCCHGYKPDLLGWRAARRAGVPVVAVSRGWTAASFKVRINEAADKLVLPFMDAVVCVSDSQRQKVLKTGVADSRTHVIRNAIDLGRFADADASYRKKLQKFFASPRRLIIGAAGRLSPEKGFDQTVEAARIVLNDEPGAGFVIFGAGPQQTQLADQIKRKGLSESMILAGFQPDLDKWLAALDVFVLSSFTEGLPNVVLEAFAAKTPVVATAVGGTPETIVDGDCGFLVPPRDPPALAQKILGLLQDDSLRREMGKRGRERVQRHFTFASQAEQYLRLFVDLTRAVENKPSTSKNLNAEHNLQCN